MPSAVLSVLNFISSFQINGRNLFKLCLFFKILITPTQILELDQTQIIIFYRCRIAHVVVDVDVLDLNDNPPVFLNKPYQAIVSKQAAVNSKVIQVVAVDADKGSNGDIYYQFVRGSGEYFRVERKSGIISLRKKLDSYRKDYVITIAAYDGGSPSYSAEIPGKHCLLW